MDIDRDKPVYVISVVADMLGVPQQTLRIYEKASLIRPRRTSQNTRLYSQSDVEKLQRIIRLHQDLGINLAGIEVILHMRMKMERMQTEFEGFVKFARERIDSDAFTAPDENSTDLVPLSEQGANIMRIIDILTRDEPENR
ncbi:MAG TPA: MerR family transcriptional regulator [bacterium]|nr:MerR family transcriptional regulator [bacterium]